MLLAMISELKLVLIFCRIVVSYLTHCARDETLIFTPRMKGSPMAERILAAGGSSYKVRVHPQGAVKAYCTSISPTLFSAAFDPMRKIKASKSHLHSHSSTKRRHKVFHSHVCDFPCCKFDKMPCTNQSIHLYHSSSAQFLSPKPHRRFKRQKRGKMTGWI